MQWADAAIILSARKYGESSAVVRVLTREHGLFAGVARGANSKNNRGIIQPGNVASANWQARLSAQLGSFKLELLEAHAAHIMQDAAKLASLTSACALVETALPERHPYPRLFSNFHEFLHILDSTENWQQDYVKFELSLLAESGFALDLSECAATGGTSDLIYVSPKSGRAVCRDAGEPYKQKMLPLPQFLLPNKLPLPNLPPQAGEGKSKSPLPAGGRVREGVNLVQYARELRANQTEAETKLWHHLRAHRFDGYSFRSQYPIDEKYIADFVCLEKKLIIEVDGGQHAEQVEYDQMRSEFMEEKGFDIIRFWNNEVMENLEGVLTLIAEKLKTSSPPLPRKREREQKNPPPTKAHSPEPEAYIKEILAGMRLTGYFLEHSLLAPHGKKLPAARLRLCQILKDIDASETATN
jgi:DNA repair protein RecO (recombination protein O)